MDILDRIDHFRKQCGWSINNLAMEAGLTQSTLNNLYTRKAEPKISTLRAICNALGISLAEFFSEDYPPNDESITLEDLEILKNISHLSQKQKQALLFLLRSLK